MLLLLTISVFAGPPASEADVSAQFQRCVARILDNKMMSYSQQHRTRIGQGQGAIDRRIRQFFGQATPHNTDHKHEKARSVSAARSISRNGDAQYMPGYRLRTERRVLDPNYPALGFQEGNGRMIKYVRLPNAIGFDRGRSTSFMRVEISPSGEFHGHPMSLARLRQFCSECVRHIQRDEFEN